MLFKKLGIKQRDSKTLLFTDVITDQSDVQGASANLKLGGILQFKPRLPGLSRTRYPGLFAVESALYSSSSSGGFFRAGTI